MGAAATGCIADDGPACQCRRSDDEDEVDLESFDAAATCVHPIRSLAEKEEPGRNPCGAVGGIPSLGECMGRRLPDKDEDVAESDVDGAQGRPSLADGAIDAKVPVKSDVMPQAEQPAASDAIDSGVPLSKGVESLSPELIHDLIKKGQCLLVDVRGADRASGLIQGAVHIPAISRTSPFPVRLPQLLQEWKDKRLIVFFCQFCKHRAPFCANLFRQYADVVQRVAILEGGFRAWQSKGLPVQAGGGTEAECANADALALHQGMLIKRTNLGG